MLSLTDIAPVYFEDLSIQKQIEVWQRVAQIVGHELDRGEDEDEFTYENRLREETDHRINTLNQIG